VKFALPFTAVAMVAIAAGCSSSKPTTSASLTPTPAVAQIPPAPLPAEPAAETTAPPAEPLAMDTSTPGPNQDFSQGNGPAFPASGGKYTIKPGDTLYRIALTHYGEGKQWKKIIAANPGLSPSHLRVGQTINLP
jgi:5'-nucleotidase